MGTKTEVTPSSGNVFADLGIANPEETKTKAELVHAITAALEMRGLIDKQKEAGLLMGIDQPKVSKLLRGQVREFSIERLLRLLVRLGSDVEIKVKLPKKKVTKAGHLHVTAG